MSERAGMVGRIACCVPPARGTLDRRHSAHTVTDPLVEAAPMHLLERATARRDPLLDGGALFLLGAGTNAAPLGSMDIAWRTVTRSREHHRWVHRILKLKISVNHGTPAFPSPMAQTQPNT